VRLFTCECLRFDCMPSCSRKFLTSRQLQFLAAALLLISVAVSSVRSNPNN